MKALVLASVATPGLRETAKGALAYRRLISFISGLNVDHRIVLLSDNSWDKIFELAGIVRTRTDLSSRLFRHEILFECEDGTFYRGRFPTRIIHEFQADWGRFQQLDVNVREAIVDALLGERDMRGPGMMRHITSSVDDYLAERAERQQLEIGDLDAVNVESPVTGNESA